MTTLPYFHIQEGGKAEENMAQKRAALLEKRMRREKETQQKKIQLEAELEQKKEEARYVITQSIVDFNSLFSKTAGKTITLNSIHFFMLLNCATEVEVLMPLLANGFRLG